MYYNRQAVLKCMSYLVRRVLHFNFPIFSRNKKMKYGHCIFQQGKKLRLAVAVSMRD